jgi:hypothetical protein
MSYLYERAEASKAMTPSADASAPVPITPQAYADAGAKVGVPCTSVFVELKTNSAIRYSVATERTLTVKQTSS